MLFNYDEHSAYVFFIQKKSGTTCPLERPVAPLFLNTLMIRK